MTKQERYQARKHFDALAEFDAKEQRYCYRIWRYDTEAGKAVPTELTFEKEDIARQILDELFGCEVEHDTR